MTGDTVTIDDALRVGPTGGYTGTWRRDSSPQARQHDLDRSGRPDVADRHAADRGVGPRGRRAPRSGRDEPHHGAQLHAGGGGPTRRRTRLACDPRAIQLTGAASLDGAANLDFFDVFVEVPLDGSFTLMTADAGVAGRFWGQKIDNLPPDVAVKLDYQQADRVIIRFGPPAPLTYVATSGGGN